MNKTKPPITWNDLSHDARMKHLKTEERICIESLARVRKNIDLELEKERKKSS